MTYAQCKMEVLDEAERKGRVAALQGLPPEPMPKRENFRHGWEWVSANAYYECWMTGYNSVL